MNIDRIIAYIAFIMSVIAFFCVISLSGDVRKVSEGDGKVMSGILNRIDSLEQRLFNIESSIQCEEYEQYELERKHNTRRF